jgi:hypothetical protein
MVDFLLLFQVQLSLQDFKESLENSINPSQILITFLLQREKGVKRDAIFQPTQNYSNGKKSEKCHKFNFSFCPFMFFSTLIKQ